jgi:VWFA-related protein
MRGERIVVGWKARDVAALVALLCVATCLLVGREGRAGQQGTAVATAPVVRTTTRLVQVSVIARDKKGEAARDLTAADFVVLDNGHPQKIEIFRKETSELPAKAPAALPPDMYTNQMRRTNSVPGNATMLLLDGLNTEISDQGYARQQILKFLGQIHAQDRMAVFTLARQLHVLQDFTSDSTKLVAAVGKYSGQTTMDLEASTPTDLQTGDQTIDAVLQDAFQREANMYIQERVDITVGALIDIANYAKALPGRKNLLWISGSFPFSVGYENLETIARMMNNPKSEGNIPGEQLLFAEEVEKAARALNDANIAVYPVDARGLLGIDMRTAKGSSKTAGYGAMNSTPPGGPGGGSPGGGRNGGRGTGGGLGTGHKPRLGNASASNAVSPTNPMLNPDHTTFESMDALADGTGGKAFYNTNDISGSMQRAIEDSRVTYEIGYYPAEVKWDGSFHAITVQVKRPEVEVRARKGYFALPETVPSTEEVKGIVSSAVVSPLESSGLNLAVRLKAAKQGNALVVTAMIFFDPRAMQFEARDGHYSGAANLVVAQLNEKNQIVSSEQQAFPLNFGTSQYEQFLRQQVELTQEIKVVPGVERVRVVLCDGLSGKVGTVTVPLGKYFVASGVGE